MSLESGLESKCQETPGVIDKVKKHWERNGPTYKANGLIIGVGLLSIYAAYEVLSSGQSNNTYGTRLFI